MKCISLYSTEGAYYIVHIEIGGRSSVDLIS
jgi:hypothetical protein